MRAGVTEWVGVAERVGAACVCGCGSRPRARLLRQDGFGSYDPACDPIYLNEDDGGDAWLADIASMVRDDDEPPAAGGA